MFGRSCKGKEAEGADENEGRVGRGDGETFAALSREDGASTSNLATDVRVFSEYFCVTGLIRFSRIFDVFYGFSRIWASFGRFLLSFEKTTPGVTIFRGALAGEYTVYQCPQGWYPSVAVEGPQG